MVVPLEPETESEVVTQEHDPEADGIIAQYFDDVRRFALLSRTEENALWRRIERFKARVRRILYTSSIALPTLMKVWQQVQREEIPLRQMIENVDTTSYDHPTPLAHLEEAMGQLQQLATRLQQLETHWPVAVGSAQALRALRQERVSLWQQWIATCAALRLHASVHEAMRLALDVAHRTTPDPALRLSHRAWMRAQQELERAKIQMLRANLRLVIHVAKHYRSQGVPFLDLIQEGNMGLMRALEKFEPHRGLKFVTYAYWWVRQAIGRAIVEQHCTVRLPGHVVERKKKLRAADEKLWQVHGRAPSTQELSTALGWTPHVVEAVQSARRAIVRLHEPVTEGSSVLEDLVEDDQAPQPDTLVANRELQQRVAECLADLPEREAQILRLRFGLETDHPHSLQEIGVLFGLSRERIRQLEKVALETLRRSEGGTLLADFAGAR